MSAVQAPAWLRMSGRESSLRATARGKLVHTWLFQRQRPAQSWEELCSQTFPKTTVISAETQIIMYVSNSRAGSLEGLFVSRRYNTLGLLINGSSHRSKVSLRQNHALDFMVWHCCLVGLLLLLKSKIWTLFLYLLQVGDAAIYPAAIWFHCWTFCFIKPYFC